MKPLSRDFVYRGDLDHKSFWDIAEITSLPYIREEFNDKNQIEEWKAHGHTPRTGMLFDMRNKDQPATTNKLIAWGEGNHLKHVGISYYKMMPGDNLPYHSDSYTRYIDIFNLQEHKQNIYRYIFFVDHWKPGHILEVNGHSFSNWWPGNYVGWKYDTPHMAANLGLEPRYTIQLTGVKY